MTTPEEAEGLALNWENAGRPNAARMLREYAAALRRLGKLERMLERDAELTVGRADEGWVARSWPYTGAPPAETPISDTPLAALLALADALEVGE